jgi:hypothetical protein
MSSRLALGVSVVALVATLGTINYLLGTIAHLNQRIVALERGAGPVAGARGAKAAKTDGAFAVPARAARACALPPAVAIGD